MALPPDSSLTHREIQELLSHPLPSVRAEIALQIAERLIAYQRVPEALDMIDLAWTLGQRTPAVLQTLVSLFVSLHQPHEALERCREAALHYMLAGDCEAVIMCMDLSRMITAHDKQQSSDPILYRCLAEVLKGKQFPERPPRVAPPYRVGYVLWGDEEPRTPLSHLFARIALLHDRSRIEPIFFSLNKAPQTHGVEEHPAVALLRDSGFTIHYNPAGQSGTWQTACGLAETIYRQEIDIVVFQSQFPVFCVTALLRPAPIVLGFDHGNPDGYVTPALDAALSAVPRLHIEHKAPSILLPPTFLNPTVPSTDVASRESLHVPPRAPLVVTCGFASKFDTRIDRVWEFFRMMDRVLIEQPQAYWCIVGVPSERIQSLLETISPTARQRIRTFGPVPDITPYLRAADVYLDSFPISGGLTVHEAMRLGIPTCTYRFYRNGRFNKLESYSMVGDFLPDDSPLLVESTVQAIEARLKRLLHEESLRALHKEHGQAFAERVSDHTTFVRYLEHVYLQLENARSPHPDTTLRETPPDNH